MIMAVEEFKRGKESKVTRKTGETRGGVEITIDVDKISERICSRGTIAQGREEAVCGDQGV